jgi:hypothetical protein
LKNRNLDHSDDWETPKYFYKELNKEFSFDFDPCPLEQEITPYTDGLIIDWGQRNFINPPYSQKLKEGFVKRAVNDFSDRMNVFLIPVSTSTILFHDWILPNKSEIRFIRRRIPFIGINSKGYYVNWHLTDRIAPEGVKHVKNSGMHDSMVVIFNTLGG